MKTGAFLRSSDLPLAVLGVLGLAFLILRSILPAPVAAEAVVEDAADAVRLMERSLEAVRAARAAAGLPIDAATDLNRTGLVGREASPTTTSLGHLEAKRTAANPAFAGALVRMLREAGVGRGDAIAVGASGSFPGLVVATLCAAQAMGVKALPIVSLGASNWGANDPRWTNLDILEALNRAGVLDVPILAASLGGEGDDGRDMAPEGRALLKRRIEDWGGAFLPPGDLPASVAARMKMCEEWAAGTSIKAFVNVGGSWVDMGTDPDVLKLKPGYNPASAVIIPPVERRGLMQAWAARGVPVVHLLFVKGLCDRYGIAWDPFPLNPASALGARPGKESPVRRALGPVFLGLLALGAGWLRLRRRRADGL